jgi:hypothetical protein
VACDGRQFLHLQPQRPMTVGVRSISPLAALLAYRFAGFLLFPELQNAPGDGSLAYIHAVTAQHQTRPPGASCACLLQRLEYLRHLRTFLKWRTKNATAILNNFLSMAHSSPKAFHSA